MALEMQDLMALKSMGNEGGMTPYEQFKTQHLQAKSHTSGVGIAGLVLGTVGAAAAIGAWIFGPTYANAKANQAREAAYAAKELAAAQNQGLRDIVTSLAGTVTAERAERIAGDVTLTNTVNDSVQGSQQGSLTAQQAAELSSIQSVQQNLLNQAIMGNLSENPQKVQIYSAPQPCGCPGCGCNG